MICRSDQLALLSGTISLTNYLSAATDGDTTSCFPLKCQLSWASFAGVASVSIDCNSCIPSFRCTGTCVSQQGTRRRCATRRRCGRGTQRRGPASGWWPPLPATTACRGSATGASAPEPAFTCLSGCSPAHSKSCKPGLLAVLMGHFGREAHRLRCVCFQPTQGTNSGWVCSFSVGSSMAHMKELRCPLQLGRLRGRRTCLQHVISYANLPRNYKTWIYSEPEGADGDCGRGPTAWDKICSSGLRPEAILAILIHRC